VVGDLESQGLGSLPVPGLLPVCGQAVQGLDVAVVGGTMAEVMRPLQAVAFPGCPAEVV
jgi:hypothetical protein